MVRQRMLQVVGERPVVDVVEVEPDRLVPGQVGAAGDLPQAGDAGADQQPAPDVAEEVAVVGGQRTRADQRHLALEHVDQLGQLVERAGPQEPADREDPRVFLDLEEHAVGLVLVDQSWPGAPRRRRTWCGTSRPGTSGPRGRPGAGGRRPGRGRRSGCRCAISDEQRREQQQPERRRRPGRAGSWPASAGPERVGSSTCSSGRPSIGRMCTRGPGDVGELRRDDQVDAGALELPGQPAQLAGLGAGRAADRDGVGADLADQRQHVAAGVHRHRGLDAPGGGVAVGEVDGDRDQAGGRVAGDRGVDLERLGQRADQHHPVRGRGRCAGAPCAAPAGPVTGRAG